MNLLSDIAAWIQGHTFLLIEGAGLWLLLLVASIIAVRVYLVSIPSDHFMQGHKPFEAMRDSHPALRWTVLVIKNLVGAALALMGLVMLVTPGPGWIALLMGVALLDIPGKRAVERKIIQRPLLLDWVNRLRTNAGRPKLVFSSAAHSMPS